MLIALPVELLVKVCQHVTPKDVRMLRETCARMNQVIREHIHTLPRIDIRMRIERLDMTKRIVLIALMDDCNNTPLRCQALGMWTDNDEEIYNIAITGGTIVPVWKVSSIKERLRDILTQQIAINNVVRIKELDLPLPLHDTIEEVLVKTGCRPIRHIITRHDMRTCGTQTDVIIPQRRLVDRRSV